MDSLEGAIPRPGGAARSREVRRESPLPRGSVRAPVRAGSGAHHSFELSPQWGARRRVLGNRRRMSRRSPTASQFAPEVWRWARSSAQRCSVRGGNITCRRSEVALLNDAAGSEPTAEQGGVAGARKQIGRQLHILSAVGCDDERAARARHHNGVVDYLESVDRLVQPLLPIRNCNSVVGVRTFLKEIALQVYHAAIRGVGKIP